MARTPTIPTYRLHRPSGQAVATFKDHVTGKRRDVYLGRYGSNASRERYAAAITEWTRQGHRASPAPGRGEQPRVVHVMVAFYRHVIDTKGHESSAVSKTGSAMRPLKRLYGRSNAAEFGPVALRNVRTAMVAEGMSRGHVNDLVRRIMRAFKHAASIELVPAGVVTALQTVAPLCRGEEGVGEGRRIKAVDLADVERTLPHLTAPLQAAVRLLLLTGARPSELLGVRPRDLDMSGPVWWAELKNHKTADQGKPRALAFGPAAQRIITPLLTDRPIDRPLICPQDIERAAPKGQRQREGQPRPQPKTDRRVRDRYDQSSLRRAVERACRVAGVEKWTPYQLRHRASSELRRKAGLEAASLTLGHSSATLTDAVYAVYAVYAERDRSKVEEVMLKHG